MSANEDLKTLGHEDMLRKIDKLRELNINTMVPLPQLVVVGDQSSGKSSVLESLTGFSFPRGPTLCTRYATQIACRHDKQESVTISIIPRPDAGDELKSRLAKFHHRFTGKLDSGKLADVFAQASAAMGISTTTADGEDRSTPAFSNDVLKIEVAGKEQPHLTFIDVPGIFRVITPGITTETDVTLVGNMVKSYMADRRTIILAVVPCNTDITTQEILKHAEEADPERARTMVVLTKPDLVHEKVTRDIVVDLVLGKGNLVLGYHVVQNRGADDDKSTWSDLGAKESAFFSKDPWSSVSGHCGVASLKVKLRQRLYQIMKKGLPEVKAEMADGLRARKQSLNSLGPARSDPPSQRQYLVKLATEFQIITQAALNGYYSGEKVFRMNSSLKLITHVFKLQEEFAKTFQDRAHLNKFSISDEEEDVVESEDSHSHEERKDGHEPSQSIPNETPPEFDELGAVLVGEDYECPPVDETPLMEKITDIFESSRGPDLGTFGGTMLSAVFEEQSKKWKPLAMCHIGKVIRLVHGFIESLLQHVCSDEQVRNQLWNGILLDKLRDCYVKAIENAEFLLHIECGTRPSTFNHYFNDTLQKKRAKRQKELLESKAVKFQLVEGSKQGGLYVAVDDMEKISINKHNDEQLCDDILDVFESYYKVAQKRFVDVLYQQTIGHFLLEGDSSPLKILGPELVIGLRDDELETVAGEDEDSKEKRLAWQREAVNLEAALKIL